MAAPIRLSAEARRHMERKEYLDNDDYRRIAKDIVRLMSKNRVSCRDTKILMECVICEIEEQIVQTPES